MFGKNKGFSLIEIIAVVTVISIVSAVVVVSSRNLSSLKLDAEARKIVADINWIRQKAISSGSHHAVSFQITPRNYVLYVSPTASEADFINSSNYIKQESLSAGLLLSPLVLWIYAPLGTMAGPQNIVLSDGANTKQILIYPQTGYLKIE